MYFFYWKRKMRYILGKSVTFINLPLGKMCDNSIGKHRIQYSWQGYLLTQSRS